MIKPPKKFNQRSKTWQIIILIIAIVVVVGGGVLFVGATAGWFDSGPKTFSLDAEYYGSPEPQILTTPEYEELIEAKKSFIVIAYLPTCTADIIKFMRTYAEEHQIKYYYFNWSDLRESSLGKTVKFSPSVILISKGEVIDYLQADSDAYLEQYNNYDAFAAWLDSYLEYGKS